MAKPIVLIIRDGWGINPGGKERREENGDATLLARTPFHDRLYREYPGGKLSASGLDVGLPEGQMGNSEVGHLNLGRAGSFIRILLESIRRSRKANSLAIRSRRKLSRAPGAIGSIFSDWFLTVAFIVTTSIFSLWPRKRKPRE